ncbi:hypothetical protein BDZ91DRAFT_787566 [Kalaharituber pfeilii]|nr:hypothetical protein BDZ91DRAFT_787566 [Kalaharituber pfeilii]
MAHATPPPLPTTFHRTLSPWSFSSSHDPALDPSTGSNRLLDTKSPDMFNVERRNQNSICPGSTPLPMPGPRNHGRPPLSMDSNRPLPVESTINQDAKPATGVSSQVSWTHTPIISPYGVIGSSINLSTGHPVRGDGQHRQLASVPTPAIRTAIPLRDNLPQLPITSLSAPPFQTSFFPLFGPPGTRQGFIMPGDWSINHHGFLISENARRLNAMALEVDKAEPHRRTSSERLEGPAAGCRMCAMTPRVMLFPCEHSVCSECGSRFMMASGGMYCSCGELVSSMINLNIPRTLDLRPSYYMPLLPQQSRPPPGLPLPVNRKENPTGPMAFTSTIQLPLPRSVTPQQREQLSISSSGMKVIPTTSTLVMDAETAIENAPFVELGRHALAQNWCCVKISNIPYSVTGENIMEFLGKNAKVVPDDVGLSVHIIMDRASGKTMDAFVEFTCPKDAYRCVTRKRGKILGSRHVLLDVVNQEELMKEIFPRARGVTWEGVIPKVINTENGNTKADIVTKEELVLVVGHARTPHRSPFSRKCLQRPYESILSIVAKFPWFAVGIYTMHQRDIIFQALISVIDILKRQCKRGRTTPNLDAGLLRKLCKAGVFCSGFTSKQKFEIIKVGEFGAESLVKEVDEDIRGFEGLQALSRKRGAETKIVEIFGTLSALHNTQFSNPTPISTAVEPTADPEKQSAISRLPSALIDELDEPGHSPKAVSTIIPLLPSVPLTEKEIQMQSTYTMAEMAELEWAAIEKYVTAILPPRGRNQKALALNSSNTNACKRAS